MCDRLALAWLAHLYGTMRSDGLDKWTVLPPIFKQSIATLPTVSSLSRTHASDDPALACDAAPMLRFLNTIYYALYLFA